MRFVTVFTLYFALWSCAEKPKPEAYIPLDAEWVVRADLQWIALEILTAEEDSISNKNSAPQSDSKQVLNDRHPFIHIISNPLNSGINVLGDIWIYGTNIDTGTSKEVVLVGISSVKSFEERLKEQNLNWEKDEKGISKYSDEIFSIEWNNRVLAIAKNDNPEVLRSMLKENMSLQKINWLAKILQSDHPSNLYLSGNFLRKYFGEAFNGSAFTGDISLSSKGIHVTGELKCEDLNYISTLFSNAEYPDQNFRNIPAKNQLNFASVFAIDYTQADSLLLSTLQKLGILDSTDSDKTTKTFENVWNGQLQYLRYNNSKGSPYSIKAGTNSNEVCRNLISTYYDMGALSRLNPTEYSLAQLFTISCDENFLHWKSQNIPTLPDSEYEAIPPCRAYIFAKIPHLSEAFWEKVDSNLFQPLNEWEVDWLEGNISNSQVPNDSIYSIKLDLTFNHNLRSLAKKKFLN